MFLICQATLSEHVIKVHVFNVPSLMLAGVIEGNMYFFT